MVNNQKRKYTNLCVLFFFILILISFSGMVSGQQGIAESVEEKLAELSDEEKKVLEELFALVQSIEDMELDEQRVGEEKEKLEQEIKQLEREIAAEEALYQDKEEALRQVLKSYQRMGPSSYLERLLDSSSLAVFLRRLNILRDLTQNTGELLDQIQESKDKLAAEKTKLDTKLVALKDVQERLAESISRTIEVKEKQEEYLASLAEEREFYEDQLTNMKKAWSELLVFFPEVSMSVSRIVKEADLPADAVKIIWGPSGIRASITQETLNSIFIDYGLDDMAFGFYEKRVEITVPDKSLVLTGTFILEEKILKYQAEGGTFYGMNLTPGNLEELFAEEELLLELENLVGNNDVRSVEVSNGSLELLITPVFSR